MLRINPQQLANIATSRFEQRLVRVLVETVPDAQGVIDTPKGRQLLREQCDLARSYRLLSELDIARFVITAWLIGPQFDSRIPAFTEILNDTQLTPSQKSEAIARVASTVLTELTISKYQV
jgi:hypothetical protein